MRHNLSRGLAWTIVVLGVLLLAIGIAGLVKPTVVVLDGSPPRDGNALARELVYRQAMLMVSMTYAGLLTAAGLLVAALGGTLVFTLRKPTARAAPALETPTTP